MTGDRNEERRKMQEIREEEEEEINIRNKKRRDEKAIRGEGRNRKINKEENYRGEVEEGRGGHDGRGWFVRERKGGGGMAKGQERIGEGSDYGEDYI